MTETTNKPEKKFKAGLVCVAVWKNMAKGKEGEEDRPFRTLTLDRRYQDAAGEWKSTSQLRLNDVPRAIVLLGKAFEHLITSPKTGDEASSQEESPE